MSSEYHYKQVVRQSIDNQISSRLIDQKYKQLSPKRNTNQYSHLSGLSQANSGLYSSGISSSTRSVGSLPPYQSAYDDSWSQYKSKVNSRQVQKCIESQILLSDLRKQRRYQKLDMLGQINSLHDRFNNEQSNHSNYIPYKPSRSQLSTPTSAVAAASSSIQAKWERKINEKLQLNTQNSDTVESIVTPTESKREQQPQKDQVLERKQSQKSPVVSPVASSMRQAEPASFNRDAQDKEKESDTIIAQLRLQVKKLQQENAKNIEAAVKQEEEKSREAVAAEREKVEQLHEKCTQLESELHKQASEMQLSLQGIKENYESQMKQFEELINSEAFQTKLQANPNNRNEDDEIDEEDRILLYAIKNNPELLEIMHDKLLGGQQNGEEEAAADSNAPSKANSAALEQSQKENMLLVQRITQLENQLQRKDTYVAEMTKNSDLKGLEISKLEDMIDNFKQIQLHVVQEKDILQEENERLNSELDQYKEYINRLTQHASRNQQLNEVEDEEGEEEEDGEYNHQMEGEDEGEYIEDGEEQEQADQAEEGEYENQNGGVELQQDGDADDDGDEDGMY